jgi:flagellar protein FlgJ
MIRKNAKEVIVVEIGKIAGSSAENLKYGTTSRTGDDFDKKLKNITDSQDEKKLKNVCKQFEGIMLGIMYKQMKATVPKNALIPNGSGREIFESMLDERIVEEASKDRSYGLADQLYKQLSKQIGDK